MSKFIVTLGASTGVGSVVQCSSTTATINGKPIAVVGDIATHPYGADTLIEGMPTILLNGKPVVFSTAKTAMGGSVLPNTSVKISSPTFESYTGIVHSARVESALLSSDTKPKNEKELKKQIAAQHKETPQKCGEVSLKSDFAWKHLIRIANDDGSWIFQYHITGIFGKDVSQDAVRKLYDACIKKSLENPDIEVCENSIYGLNAAYNTRTNKIYVSRAIVEQAVEDNECRHKLMAALVEEFGHHIDWLLRYKYDANANKDAEGDEGARFAYQSIYKVYEVDVLKKSTIPFAEAQTPDGSFGLEWNISELHQALNKYTEGRQHGTDDHVGNFEGFKIEDLSEKKGFGHKNIQELAIDRSGVRVLQNDIAIDFMYRGNWLRDYSQLLAPVLFDPSSALKDTPAEFMQKYYDEFAPEPEKLKELLTNIVRVLAFTKFYGGEEKDQAIARAKDTDPIKALRDMIDNGKGDGLIPGFNDLIGISCYYDHCDNPYDKEQHAQGKTQRPLSQRIEKAGGVPLDVNTLRVDRFTGVKKYLKGESAAGHTPTVSQHVKSLLHGVTNLTGSVNQVRLGTLLHIVQDFYGHSNYTEAYLVKVWFDKVVTWCADADKCRSYSNKEMKWNTSDPSKVLNTERCNQIYQQYKNKYAKDAKMMSKDGEHVNIKAFYTPITSGTYGFDDMFSTMMDMVSEKVFAIQLETPSHHKMQQGCMYANDLMVLLACRYYDKIRKNKEKSTAEEYFLTYLNARDYWLEAKEYIPSWFSWISDKMDELVMNRLDAAILVYRNIAMHYITLIIAKLVKEYQLAIESNIQNLLNGTYNHGDNPSHTMLAKDSASHPVNNLAGEMAVNSSVNIIKFLNAKLSGTQLNYNVIDDVITHPLLTNHFDSEVKHWAKDNPLKVLRCCLYSEVFESLRIAIIASEKAKKKIDELLQDKQNIGANRASGVDNEEDKISQEKDINAIGVKNKQLIASLNKLMADYANGSNKYRELDAQTLVEFTSLYYPSVETDDSLNIAIKKIWIESVEEKMDLTGIWNRVTSQVRAKSFVPRM